MRLLVGAVPGSNISNAWIIAKGDGFHASLTIDAGTDAKTDIPVQGIDGLANIDFIIISDNRIVSIHAQNIPVDAKIVVSGRDALHFEGHIYHRKMKPPGVAPACMLRCTPFSSPMVGPGCRECEVNGLVFKLCC